MTLISLPHLVTRLKSVFDVLAKHQPIDVGYMYTPSGMRSEGRGMVPWLAEMVGGEQEKVQAVGKRLIGIEPSKDVWKKMFG
jgi:hypothetical protein